MSSIYDDMMKPKTHDDEGNLLKTDDRDAEHWVPKTKMAEKVDPFLPGGWKTLPPSVGLTQRVLQNIDWSDVKAGSVSLTMKNGEMISLHIPRPKVNLKVNND